MAASGALFSRWTVGFPLAGAVALAASLIGLQVLISAVVVLLIGCTFSSVHHAETLAHRLGALFGSLVLALAISVIEAGLIVSMMLGGDQPELARDSIFPALLIALNGILGVCLLLGGGRHYEQNFRVSASNAFLAVLVPLSMLTMVLPSYTMSAPGPVFTRAQLIFVAAVSFVLSMLFLYVQLVRHRSDFIADHEVVPDAPRPTARHALIASEPTANRAQPHTGLGACLRGSHHSGGGHHGTHYRSVAASGLEQSEGGAALYHLSHAIVYAQHWAKHSAGRFRSPRDLRHIYSLHHAALIR